MADPLIPPPPDYRPPTTGGEIPPPPDYFQPQPQSAAAPRADEALSIPTLQEAYSAFAEPVTQAVGWAARRTPMATLAQYLTGQSDETMERGGRGAATLIVPQTPTDALAALGTVVGGPLGPLGRIVGAGAGAGIGSWGSGKGWDEVARDAGIAGAGATAGETLTAIGSKIIRSLPNNPIIGGKRAISEGDAAGYAARMGEQSPPLAGARTAQDLRTLASGEGLDRLSAAKEAVVTQIEGMPSSSSIHRLSSQTTVSTTPLPMPSLGQPMSLREANDALSEIGARAFSKNPLDRTFNGVDQRRLYGQVAQDIEAGLHDINPDAAAVFGQMQDYYKRGRALLDPLAQERAWRFDPSGPQFNTPFFQKRVGTPKGEAILRNKLGDDGFETLRDTLLRGGEPGTVDRLAAGAGNWFDALGEMARHSTGAGQVATFLPRTALPNVGSAYAGRAPYTAPTGIQALMDYLGIQSAEQFRAAQSGTPVKIGETYGR